MDKFIHDDKGTSMISNDGATIMKLLDIVHPIVDIAKSQDAEVCSLLDHHCLVPYFSCFHSINLSCINSWMLQVRSTRKFAKYGCCLLCFWNPKFQVGDGTTIMVFFTREFLQESKPFVEDGVHPQFIIHVFRTTSKLLENTNGVANTENVTSLSPLT